MEKQLDGTAEHQAPAPLVAGTAEVRSVGGVALSGGHEPMSSGRDGLYHSDSTRPGGNQFLGGNYYNRDVEGYLEALDYQVTAEDLLGKVVIDIGSGREARFGRELNARGARVLSVNPALKDEGARRQLLGSIERDYGSDMFWYEEAKPPQNKMKKLLRINEPKPEPTRDLPSSVAALGQALPIANEAADVVVSVYGVPQYLHHLSPKLAGDDKAILSAYTDDVREQDKTLIEVSFREVLRVLKPGGKGYFADSHCAQGQTENINPYSPTDGSEVIEVLDRLRDRLTYVVVEKPLPDGSVHRVIVLTKNTNADDS